MVATVIFCRKAKYCRRNIIPVRYENSHGGKYQDYCNLGCDNNHSLVDMYECFILEETAASRFRVKGWK
jgi:hypothetical protein